MLRYLTLIALAITFAACGNDATTTENRGGEDTEHNHDHDGHDHDHAGHDHDHDHDHEADKGDGVHFGETITVEEATALADVLAKVEAGEGLEEVKVDEETTIQALPTKLEGKVSEVCQAAGCWLKLATDDGKEIFINTNHDFFVPKDLTGKTVVVAGNAYKSETSVEMLQHFAEDKGATKEEIAAITEPKVEYKLDATGLIIK
ncbi:MAG: DUF4920 domain-containing protein [Aureispira sp.]|nr:DUF4920 domain-containing protein [Aureispira sp.]